LTEASSTHSRLQSLRGQWPLCIGSGRSPSASVLTVCAVKPTFSSAAGVSSSGSYATYCRLLFPSPTLYGRRFSYLNTLERQTGAASPPAVPPLGPVMRDPQIAIRAVASPRKSGVTSAAPENAGPRYWQGASDKSLEHRPAHAQREPELLFKALIARLVLLKLPPRLPVNREHHTASPSSDRIGIFGTQCVRQLIQQR